MNIERIKQSAIKFKFNNSDSWGIITGSRHSDIFEIMFKHGVQYDRDSAVQGFITQEDRFVDRYEAALIAFDALQITDPSITQLYSEDIWPG